jgi:endonuclease/exonuclease/phosphatase family metal-dependent hydrolase
MGDLNMAPSAAARYSRLRPVATALTFPADVPDRQLDHVLTEGATMRGRGCATPLMTISDHRPLVVEIGIS